MDEYKYIAVNFKEKERKDNERVQTLEDKMDTVESIAKGANNSLPFESYQRMIEELKGLPNDALKCGQNIMIATLHVPDLWIYEASDTFVEYTYTSDEDFVAALSQDGFVQVGYYVLSALETQKVDLSGYVKKTDIATDQTAGVVRIGTLNYGLEMVPSNGNIRLIKTNDNNFASRASYGFNALTLNYFDTAMKKVFTENIIPLDDTEKAKAQRWLGVSGGKLYEHRITLSKSYEQGSNDSSFSITRVLYRTTAGTITDVADIYRYFSNITEHIYTWDDPSGLQAVYITMHSDGKLYAQYLNNNGGTISMEYTTNDYTIADTVTEV